MKYIFIIIGMVTLIVAWLWWTTYRVQQELKQEIPYLEQQTKLLRELIDEPIEETREEMIKNTEKNKG